MNRPLDELYLTWLYEQVSVEDESPSRSYWKLCRILFTKEFVWFVPNDDNRLEDGRALRDEFIEDRGLDDVDPDWMNLGCSMLELLIGLSRALSFLTDRGPRDWFWELINNLGLRTAHDSARFRPRNIQEVLDNVIWRTYEPNGRGGLFPLYYPDDDQRDVELWYQLNSYLLERT